VVFDEQITSQAKRKIRAQNVFSIFHALKCTAVLRTIVIDTTMGRGSLWKRKFQFMDSLGQLARAEQKHDSFLPPAFLLMLYPRVF
jgi:hypothetical protein